MIKRPARIGDIVRFTKNGINSTIWMVTSEIHGRLYGRGFGIVYPEALSSYPEDLDIVVPGDQLDAMKNFPNADYSTLRNLADLRSLYIS